MRTVYTDGSGLTPSQRRQVWGLFRSRVAMDQATFHRMTRDAGRILLWMDGASVRGALLGEHVETTWRSRPAQVLVVRHAVLDPVLRQGRSLAWALLRTWLRAFLRAPLQAHFLVAAMATPQDYRATLAHTPHAWPRADLPFLSPERDLLDRVCTRVFGDTWDRARGIVHGDGRWRAERSPDACVHGTRYAAWNPGQAHGDALAVLVPLTPLQAWRSFLKLRTLPAPLLHPSALDLGVDAAPGRSPHAPPPRQATCRAYTARS